MQAAPYRLSQTIWAVFRATRPATPTSLTQHLQCSRYVQSYARTRPTLPSQTRIPGRCYSQSTKSSDVEQKIVDAKERIHSSLDARAETAADAQSPLRHREDETIVHANPESSSIVHLRNRIPKSDPNVREQPERHAQLPSEKADVRSQITTKFSHFMDDLQSKIFVASQRLNDLTGYTGIERLKREIDQQESAVQAARQAVKDSRTAYSEAIAMRSATQREVNDLLQRKHAWSPQDLERFTNLYRSDHANEQAEQQSHQRLSDAEVRYEEASTKLAKSILARYHEEQIWSDKIRQMSTWGTWGLMGLNILLFIVLQLAIEPWRRRRLVRGFEEKVQVALASREKENQELRAQLSQRSGSGGAVVAAATERLAESVVDAITGSTGDNDHTSIGSVVPADRQTIEAAAEQITTGEINNLNATASKVARISETVTEGGSPDVPILESIPQSSIWSRVPSSIYPNIATTCYGAYSAVVRQFDTTSYTVMSQRQVTANFVEGLAAGVALAGGVMFVLARNR